MNYEKAHIYNPHTHKNGTKYDLHKKTGNKDKQKAYVKHCMRIYIYMYICPHTKNRPQERKEFAHEASYEVCEGSYISSTQNQKLVKYHPYKKKGNKNQKDLRMKHRMKYEKTHTYHPSTQIKNSQDTIHTK